MNTLHCCKTVLEFFNKDCRVEGCSRFADVYSGFDGNPILDLAYAMNSILYTPDIGIIRKNKQEILKCPKYVDIISCTPPNVAMIMDYTGETGGFYVNGHGYFFPMRDLVKRILKVAKHHGISTLILGDFDCEVYSNDPNRLRFVYKAVLNGDINDAGMRGYFNNVIIATENAELYKVFTGISR